MLVIIYRSHGSDKIERRPNLYSKVMCAQSLINSINSLPESTKVKIVNIHDGDEVPDLKNLFKANSAEYINVKMISASKSFVYAFNYVIDNFDENDIIYFCEDDYFHLENAFPLLMEIFSEANPDYVTLYDHPDRYFRTDNDRKNTSSIVTSNSHWITVESTCMTFGAKLVTLLNDKKTFMFYTKHNQNISRLLWYDLRGRILNFPDKKTLAWYYLLKAKRLRIRGIFNKRKLYSPLPSLSTHMEKEFLSPIIKWDTHFDI